MRILMVLGRSAGGIGAHVDQLTRKVRTQGHEVVIVTDASTAEAFDWADAHRLWPFAGVRSMRTGPLDWHRIMKLAGTVDVVHAHGHQAAVVAGLAVLRANPRPALVVSLHNELPRAGAAARVMRRVVAAVLRRAQLITGASPDLVDLARSMGAPRTELATVASPSVGAILDRSVSPVLADPEERAERRARLLASAGLPADRPLVLTVSRIAPQKDLRTLARAAAASRVGATWVVIGSGDESLRADLENEPSGIHLRFLGPRREVTDWLEAADVFVLTSLWEARALVVQEAMAAGVPVVATRTGGLPGLVGDAGVLVPVGDWAAVATEVDRLLGDALERERIGRASREVALTWDTPQAEARRWVARYTEALDS